MIRKDSEAQFHIAFINNNAFIYRQTKYFTRYKKLYRVWVTIFPILSLVSPCHSIVLMLLVLPLKGNSSDNMFVNQGVTPIELHRTKLLIDCE